MTTDELEKLPIAKLRKTQEFATWAVMVAQRQPRFIAWLWWRLHGRPEIRVEMSPTSMELMGFPCPKIGYFYVPTYKYTRVMRTLHERAIRELERRALGSEEERKKIRAEFQQKGANK
jgi:hypothetical protein